MAIAFALLMALADNPPSATARARASITVLNAYRAKPESWKPAENRGQREVIRVERDGAQVRLRLTEFE